MIGRGVHLAYRLLPEGACHMRSHHLARRILMAPALSLAVAAAVAACSSSTSAPPPPKSTATSPSTAGGDAAAIKTNWEAFFSSKTSVDQKVALLENGQDFAQVIRAESRIPLASNSSATVSNVSGITASNASVTYNVLLNGSPALTNQKGMAVKQDGTWKVGDSSFCTLLGMLNGGKAPSVCSSIH